MANTLDPDQTAPIGAVCSGSTLFASILNSSVILGNYLQQTTSADNIFRCIFSWNYCISVSDVCCNLLSYDMASECVITPFIKIDKPLVNFIFW